MSEELPRKIKVTVKPLSKRYTYANPNNGRCNFCSNLAYFWLVLKIQKNTVGFRACRQCGEEWEKK
ncbi:MAG: hypothetical protein ACRC2S_28610 [Waterburya sp.]